MAGLRILIVVFATVALAACSGPPRTERQLAARSGHGLSLDQRAALLSLRTEIAVPAAPDFDLAGFDVEANPSPFYRLSYRNPRDGTCFDITGAAEGFGGPEMPIVSLPVQLRHLPVTRAVRLYEAADDPLSTSAMNWGPGTILSEEIQLRGMAVTFGSSNANPGCTPLGLRQAARVFASLRLLGDLSQSN